MKKNEWDSEINVSEDLAKNLIEMQFPELGDIELSSIGSGWDNRVYLVNNEYIFRFPHRAIAASLIERENAVLGYLQNIIKLDIPDPKYQGHPCEIYPYHFHGYQMLEGKTGCSIELSDLERSQNITKLAAFLRTIHNINALQATKIGAREQVFDRTNRARLIQALSSRVEKINQQQIDIQINMDVYAQEIARIEKISLSNDKTLVHGDLYSRHFMFTDGVLTGVIDWGDVGINHPVVDLGVIYSFFPETSHNRFFDIYGEVSPDILVYARFLGLYSALTTLLYGHNINDSHLYIESRNAIIRINQKLLDPNPT